MVSQIGTQPRCTHSEHHRPKVQYVYPPSPTSNEPSGPPSPTQGPSSLPLSQRLRLLQAEVTALEVELSDPTHPLLRKEKEAGHGGDPGELIRGMVDVKRRIEKISRAREGRGRLVSVVLGESDVEDDIVKIEERIKNLEAQSADREGNKEVALGTSKIVSLRIPYSGPLTGMLSSVTELH